MIMGNESNVVFRAEEDGTITPLEWSAIKDEMKNNTILVLYSAGDRSIYYWVGSDAMFTVRRNIAKISNQLGEKAPDLRILRRITINQGKEDEKFNQLINS